MIKHLKKRTIFLLVVLIAVVVFAFSQRDKLALLQYIGSDDESIRQKSEETAQQTQKIKEEYNIPDVVLSEEEQNSLANGTITPEEAAQNILKSSDEKQTDSTTPASSDSESDNKEKIQNLLAQLYVLQASYSSKIEALVGECKTEYHNLDSSQQTIANKIKIVSAKLSTISSMEKECDNQVASILKQIRKIDSNLADQVQAQYESEKTIEKASLLDRYA